MGAGSPGAEAKPFSESMQWSHRYLAVESLAQGGWAIQLGLQGPSARLLAPSTPNKLPGPWAQKRDVGTPFLDVPETIPWYRKDSKRH